jgi:UDP-N-acetylmuramate dehydrogenase
MDQSLTDFLHDRRMEFRENADIKPFLTLKIGDSVSLLVIVRSLALLEELGRRLIASGTAHVVLGGGSNLAFGNEPTRAVVLANRTSGIRMGGGEIVAASGVRLASLLAWCQERHLGGLEFLAGIPGTVGGAAVVNAGAFGRSIGERITGADILDASGRVRSVTPEYFGFVYRSSRLKYGGDIVLRIRLACSPDTREAIGSRIGKNIQYRNAHHPAYRLHSAGCFFQNPTVGGSRVSAGKIIEECGFKGRRFGAIEVAEAHANFLLNRGSGRFAELEEAERMIVEAVRSRNGITLHREIVYISPSVEKY